MSTTPPLANPALTALEQRVTALEHALASRGAAIQYDDATKTITLHTPAGQSVAIADGNKTISLKDASGNSITMSPTGIAIVSAYDISFKASGNITQTAQANVTVSAANNLKVTAEQIDIEAQMTFEARGNTTAEVSAAGVLTIKGAMVEIN
jgi:phage baseplate assembly protein gpV